MARSRLVRVVGVDGWIAIHSSGERNYFTVSAANETEINEFIMIVGSDGSGSVNGLGCSG